MSQPFAIIRLKFDDFQKAYRDNQTLPGPVDQWVKDQRKREKDFNEKLPELNEQRAAAGKNPLDPVPLSTSCCMQVSLSFNGIGVSIPKAGSTPQRDNETIAGNNYILAVGEFRAFLTYRYGPTSQFTDTKEIQNRRGLVIFAGAHIEIWDGECYLQSGKGLEKYKRVSSAVMSPSFLLTNPRWFWEILDVDAKPAAVLPKWLIGWWRVWDGQTYYYYFFEDGHAVYIKEPPSPKWIPPKTIGNHGVATMLDHGPKVVWKPTAGETESTVEEFTRTNWTSETEMFATSNKYSPLGAKKLE